MDNKIKQAIIKGFKLSAEGFNGEYPCENMTDREIWNKIKGYTDDE